MGYPRSEQETVLVFEAESGMWNAYSTIPKHIRRLQKITENVEIMETDENGNPQAARCVLDEKQVRMVAKREMSEEQREAASQRFKEMHAKNSEK
jgi:hypothetical protein